MPPKYKHPVGMALRPPPSFTMKFKTFDLVRLKSSDSELERGIVLPMVEQSASMTFRKRQYRIAFNSDHIRYENEEDLELL